MLQPLSSIYIPMAKITRFLMKNNNQKLLFHTCATTYTRFKDITPVTTVPAGSQDILLQNMRSAIDSSDILNSVNRHHVIMNSKHALQALKSLFQLQKAHNSRMSNGEIVSSKDFRKLCVILKSQIRHVDLNDLIDIVKCMGYLGVPASSKIINIILGLISKQVNELSLQQITFIDFLIKDFKSTPIVKALKIALPIVFEANLLTKCDFDNASQLSDLLSFVSKRNHMEKSSDLLVDALMKKREVFSLKDARSIIFSLCDLKGYSKNYELLLCFALDIISDSHCEMGFFEIESILSKLCSTYSDTNGDPSFYHEEFCNRCAQLVVDKDLSFEHSIWIVKKLVKFNHVNLPLLDHIAKKVEQEPWQLEQCGATGYIIFLSAFSSADYKPPNWSCIKPLVFKACQGLFDRSELPWLRVTLYLCTMDCWLEELLYKVFHQDFLSSFMARDYKIDRIELLTLDQVSATLSPWPIKPRAPPGIITPIIQRNGSHIESFPLQSALCQGLGGEEYVQSGVITSLGHFLDHVLVMRKGGYPVAINLKDNEAKERVCTEDILVPQDSNMIAVLFVPSTMSSTNNERVRGIYRIQVNSIEALGIAVCPILQTVWNALPDFERIPYLMRFIQEKVSTSEISNVIVP